METNQKKEVALWLPHCSDTKCPLECFKLELLQKSSLAHTVKAQDLISSALPSIVSTCLSHFLSHSPPTLHALPKLLMTGPFGFFIHSQMWTFLFPTHTNRNNLPAKYFPSIKGTQKNPVLKNTPLLKIMGVCRKYEVIGILLCVWSFVWHVSGYIQTV